MHLITLALVFLIVLSTPRHAQAILPPDLLFNVGQQFFQFFSFITLLIGGLAGSAVVLLRSQLIFLQKHTFKIVTILIIIIGISLAGAYYVQVSKNTRAYLAYIEDLKVQLNEATRVVTTRSTSTPAFSTSTTPEEAWGAVQDARRLFNGDTLYLYGENNGDPLYLEIDLNRRQSPNGTFMHYYYLIGSSEGKDDSKYNLTYSTSSVPVLTESIRSFARTPYTDHSTREDYRGSVILNKTLFDFSATGFQGDFITRNSQAYTRYQSIGTGTVTYENKNVSVHVLSEGVHSNDFTKSIFFEGSDKIVATTRQFVLWDSANNFYMIDQSQVFSNTPEYTSHTWLLYKNRDFGYTKKSFTSDITARSNRETETSWSITAPDFDKAVIELALVKYIDDGDFQTRKRALVRGIVTDTNGTRDISGFGFIIK